MKIFWFVNIPLPAVLEHFGKGLTGSGWWLDSLAKTLCGNEKVELTIAHCSSIYEKFEKIESENIRYLIIPADKWSIIGWRSSGLVKILADIVNEADVDLVDVHGSEYVYGQITTFVKKPVVLTIQGFTNAVLEKPYGGNNLLQILYKQTHGPKDIKHAAKLLLNQLYTYLRAKSERKIFKKNNIFIGRTDWDKAMTLKLCGNLRGYYTCWEIMRDEFFATKWGGPYESNRKIFYCSGPAPYKGAEDLIKAFEIVSRQFPDIQLQLAGGSADYGWQGYLKRLAKKLEISNKVEFLPYLSAKDLSENLNSCSLYVHPSYVDNSPNTLAEAMCVGVPCVAGRTGGIPTMIKDGVEGLLYKTGDIRQLANCISRLLQEPEFAETLGANASQTALIRHSPEKVADETLHAYNQILKN